MSKPKHRSRSREKEAGIPLTKGKTSESSHLPSNTSKTEHSSRSKSKSKTSTSASTERKERHEEKKSKLKDSLEKHHSNSSGALEKHHSKRGDVSEKRHKKLKDHSADEENYKRKEKTKEKQNIIQEPSPQPKPLPAPDEDYNYDFEYEDDFESDDDAGENASKPLIHDDTHENSAASSDSPAIEPWSELVRPSSPQISPKDEQVAKIVTDLNGLTDTPLLKRLASRQGGRPPEQSQQPQLTRTKQQPRIASAERRINFLNASAVNHTALVEADERHRKLRELVVLEPVLYTIVDQPPVKDYDFYMELFGQSGKSQSSTQTGDDDLNEETQTEDPIVDTKWTQHPPHDDFGWGAETASTLDLEAGEDQDMEMFRKNHLENPRLKRFMDIAGQVMIELISAKHKARGANALMRHKSVLAFSSGFNSFELGPIAQASRIVAIALNPTTSDIFLIGFFIQESPAEDILNRTLLVEFHLDEEHPPERLFLSQGEVTCACYTPDGSVLVVGVNDGAIEAYDLHEPSSVFKSSMPWMDCPNDIALRTPAYDSSFLSSTLHDGKMYPIIDVQTLVKENDSSCQIVSLEQSGSVTLWAALRDSYGRPGVSPESQLSLQLLALIHPDPFVLRSSSEPTPLIANCMVTRADPLMFLIAVYGEVLCAKLSPFENSIILVGFSSGCLALYRLNQLNPSTMFTPPSSSRKPVSSVEWSPISQNIFYSLHGYSRLLIWDLSMGRTPQAVNDLSQQIFSRVLNTRIWLQKSENPQRSGIAYLALGLSSGKVEVHALETVRAKKEGNLLSAIKALDE